MFLWEFQGRKLKNEITSTVAVFLDLLPRHFLLDLPFAGLQRPARKLVVCIPLAFTKIPRISFFFSNFSQIFPLIKIREKSYCLHTEI
jgi:hypothetical protein